MRICLSKSTSDFNQSAYDQWSAFYDSYPNPTVAIDDLTFPTFWRTVLDQAVLEIGCGTGRHTRRLLAQGNRVTGIDLSKGMLDKIRSSANQAPLELIHADILTYTSFSHQSFDAVVSALVIEHIEDVGRLFKIIAALLKRGGKFYLSEIHPERTAQGVAAHFVDQRSGEEVQLKSFPHTEQTIRTAAESAGLTVREVETIRGDDRIAKLNPKWARHLNLPMLQVWVFEKMSDL